MSPPEPAGAEIPVAGAEIPQGARRLTVPVARLPKWLDNFADRHGGLQTRLLPDPAAPEQVVVSAADGSTVWIEVPFRPWHPTASRPLTSLQLHLNSPRRIGVLLVRRGGYAAGVFDGAELVSSKVGSGYVQGAHQRRWLVPAALRPAPGQPGEQGLRRGRRGGGAHPAARSRPAGRADLRR